MTDKIILMFGEDCVVEDIKRACESIGLEVGDGWFVVVERTKRRVATLIRWRDKDEEAK